MLLDAFAAEHRRNANADVPDAVGALHQRGHRKERFFVEQDGVYDIANSNADGIACAAFFLEDFSAAVFGAFENGILEAGRAIRQTREEKTVYGRGGPDRQ